MFENSSFKGVKIGDFLFIQGTIITLEDFGMIVKVADHMKGLCPRLHFADINLKHPEKKLKDGKKVKCRVGTFCKSFACFRMIFGLQELQHNVIFIW